MEKIKSKIIAVCAVCAVTMSFAACSGSSSSSTTVSKDDPSVSTQGGTVADVLEEPVFSAYLDMDKVVIDDNGGSAEVTQAPVQTDSKGSEITGVPVTNNSGKVVTDGKGVTVTAAVLTEQNGDVATDASGSVKTEKVTIVTDVNGDLVESGVEQASGVTEVSPGANSATYQFSRFFWSGVKSNVTGDGEYMQFKFKIKDNAPDGHYKISFDESRDESLAVINYELEYLTYGFIDGYISVGSENPIDEDVPKSDTMMFGMTNGCGNPGDVVTIYAKVYNNPGMYMLLQEIKFNCDVLEIQSIETTGIF